eukprot:scaffold2522_cov22-Tisochrysis_lutea.AAC.5
MQLNAAAGSARPSDRQISPGTLQVSAGGLPVTRFANNHGGGDGVLDTRTSDDINHQHRDVAHDGLADNARPWPPRCVDRLTLTEIICPGVTGSCASVNLPSGPDGAVGTRVHLSEMQSSWMYPGSPHCSSTTKRPLES